MARAEHLGGVPPQSFVQQVVGPENVNKCTEKNKFLRRRGGTSSRSQLLNILSNITHVEHWKYLSTRDLFALGGGGYSK